MSKNTSNKQVIIIFILFFFSQQFSRIKIQQITNHKQKKMPRSVLTPQDHAYTVPADEVDQAPWLRSGAFYRPARRRHDYMPTGSITTALFSVAILIYLVKAAIAK